MVLFTCPTCATSLEDQDMLKHLSSTRHKSIVHARTDELLECENCHDSNIHVLTLIRYGGSDIALLCQQCFGKEQDKPSTQYTLQNGSILRNFENYQRVRDLSCLLCSSEKGLNTYTTNPNMVVCSKCVKDKSLDQSGLVSENDDNFLYVLLGIKEQTKQTNQKTFSRKRTVGRSKRGGRGGRGRGRGGSSRGGSSRSKTPSENNETLRSFQSLSASEVSKQRPDDERHLTPPPQKQAPRSNGSRPQPSSASRGRGSSSSSSLRGRGSSRQVQSTSRQSQPSTRPVRPVRDQGPDSRAPRPTSRPSEKLISKKEPKRDVKVEVREATVKAQAKDTAQNIAKGLGSLSITDVEPPKKDVKGDVKKDSKKDIKKDVKKDIKRGPTEDKSPKPESKKETGRVSNVKEKKDNGSKPILNNGKLQDKTAKKELSKKDSAKKDSAKKDSAKRDPAKKDHKKDAGKTSVESAKNSQVPDGTNEDYEEFEHVPKYLSNQPKLSYDSINEYFKEMCFHLYLEEKLATDSITNFKAEWHKDNKQLFKLIIPITEEIENLVPEKFRKLGKLPFSINQSMFVARSNDKDNIWDCFIKDLNVQGRGSGRKIELLLELYKWNDAQDFPIGSLTLSILPCSATISRILFAMARIENPRFIKMLLGKDPIRQLNFKNFITLTNDQFNGSQRSAIQHVLNNSITVLQGPPGTGKTSTIYEIILQLSRNLKTFPILVVAASNVAIDNIAEKLKKDLDLTVLRIVSSEKEREYNDKHHLSDICLHHQVFDKLPLNSKETALDLRFNRKPVSQNQYKKLLTTQNSINERLIAQAHVILTTTVVAGGYQLKSVKKLPVVIMDESTQSTEASSLIPLSMPGVDRFVFVGDDKQLSSFSDVPYLEQSLFERVLKNGTYTNPHMLNVQYRMHPNISEFPIKKFYNNLLENGVTDEHRKIPGIEPLTFIDYGAKFKEEKVSNFRRGGGYTYTNRGEAELILRVLKDLVFAKIIERRNISIITPYSAQRDLLANLIQKDSLINPKNEAIEEEVDEDSLTRKKPTTIKTIVGIMISSIDAFQGREKDVIIFSCVRSNEENKIGFVKDGRRLNVALTRARSGLVLVGNKDVMSKGDPLWEELVGHLETKKYLKSEEEYFE